MSSIATFCLWSETLCVACELPITHHAGVWPHQCVVCIHQQYSLESTCPRMKGPLPLVRADEPHPLHDPVARWLGLSRQCVSACIPCAQTVGAGLLSFGSPTVYACVSCAQTAGAGLLSIGNPTIIVLVALMSAAFALSAWSRAGLYCNHQDLSPQFAGNVEVSSSAITIGQASMVCTELMRQLRYVPMAIQSVADFCELSCGTHIKKVS